MKKPDLSNCGSVVQKLGAFEGRPIADCRQMMKSKCKQVTYGMETKQQVSHPPCFTNDTITITTTTTVFLAVFS